MKRIGIVACAALAACSGRAPSRVPAISEAADHVAQGVAASVAGVQDMRRWFAGDLHMHVAPPDLPGDVTLSADEIADAARKAHMDFVVLTPHLSRGGWGARRRSFQAAWQRLAKHARQEQTPTLIPGVEYNNGAGHFTIAGLDLASATGDDLLAVARDHGAFVSVNHPFAVPTHIPGVPVSDANMSYRVWTEGARGFTDLDGVEVWNIPLALANLISRPGGQTGEARAWAAANRVVHERHRKIAAVGGTDNHTLVVLPTTWVLANDASERSILDGLHAAATCVGGPQGGSLRAHGDGDAPDHWARIGDSVHAPATTTLVWDGAAHVFVDGVDQGEHTGRFTHETHGELHTYRIEIGDSRCSFIYANL
jgi:hypothetical protein